MQLLKPLPTLVTGVIIGAIVWPMVRGRIGM